VTYRGEITQIFVNPWAANGKYEADRGKSYVASYRTTDLHPDQETALKKVIHTWPGVMTLKALALKRVMDTKQLAKLAYFGKDACRCYKMPCICEPLAKLDACRIVAHSRIGLTWRFLAGAELLTGKDYSAIKDDLVIPIWHNFSYCITISDLAVWCATDTCRCKGCRIQYQVIERKWFDNCKFTRSYYEFLNSHKKADRIKYIVTRPYQESDCQMRDLDVAVNLQIQKALASCPISGFIFESTNRCTDIVRWLGSSAYSPGDYVIEVKGDEMFVMFTKKGRFRQLGAICDRMSERERDLEFMDRIVFD
jgi:hypothetical protein